MSFDPTHEAQRLHELQERLRRTRAITPELMAHVIARACLRFQAHHPNAKARVLGLVEAGAFAEATLALLELELPQWRLRRLIREDGEWHCSFSSQPWLPLDLDDMAEASHESLPLAILTAFVEARRHSLAAGEERPKSVPQVRPIPDCAICCDNFA